VDAGRQQEWEICVVASSKIGQDIWKAWCEQIKDSIEHVNLYELGIDAQAVGQLSRELAVRCTAIPVRQTETHLVIATSEEDFDEAAVQLPESMNRRLKFVIAPREQVISAIEAYYHISLS
jgi:hypothetical protein